MQTIGPIPIPCYSLFLSTAPRGEGYPKPALKSFCLLARVMPPALEERATGATVVLMRCNQPIEELSVAQQSGVAAAFHGGRTMLTLRQKARHAPVDRCHGCLLQQDCKYIHTNYTTYYI